MQNQLTTLKENWQQSQSSAKKAIATHAAAIKQYQDKQAAKNWYPDYDLCAQTTGALQKLYAAYQELQNVCLQLYSNIQEQQQHQAETETERHHRSHPGPMNIKTAYWRYFIQSGGLAAFAGPTCPKTDREQMINLMQKDLKQVPELQQCINYLNTL